MAYDKFDSVRLTAQVLNVSGSPTNPTNLQIRYKIPPSTTIQKTWPTDSEIVQDSAGNFHIDLSLDMDGTWQYWWRATGSVTAASGLKTFSVIDQGL